MLTINKIVTFIARPSLFLLVLLPTNISACALLPESIELAPIHPDQHSKNKNLFTALNSPKKDQAQKLLKIQHLLDGNANVNAQDSNHNNPIHIAAKTNNAQLVSLILENKADITQLTQKKSSCFHYAASTGATEALKLLLHHEYQLLQHALLEPRIQIMTSLLSCFPTAIMSIILNYSLDQGATSLMQEDSNQQTALISTRNNLYKEYLPKKQRDLQQCIKLLQGHQRKLYNLFVQQITQFTTQLIAHTM